MSHTTHTMEQDMNRVENKSIYKVGQVPARQVSQGKPFKYKKFFGVDLPEEAKNIKNEQGKKGKSKRSQRRGGPVGYTDLIKAATEAAVVESQLYDLSVTGAASGLNGSKTLLDLNANSISSEDANGTPTNRLMSEVSVTSAPECDAVTKPLTVNEVESTFNSVAVAPAAVPAVKVANCDKSENVNEQAECDIEPEDKEIADLMSSISLNNTEKSTCNESTFSAISDSSSINNSLKVPEASFASDSSHRSGHSRKGRRDRDEYRSKRISKRNKSPLLYNHAMNGYSDSRHRERGDFGGRQSRGLPPKPSSTQQYPNRVNYKVVTFPREPPFYYNNMVFNNSSNTPVYVNNSVNTSVYNPANIQQAQAVSQTPLYNPTQVYPVASMQGQQPYMFIPQNDSPPKPMPAVSAAVAFGSEATRRHSLGSSVASDDLFGSDRQIPTPNGSVHSLSTDPTAPSSLNSSLASTTTGGTEHLMGQQNTGMPCLHHHPVTMNNQTYLIQCFNVSCLHPGSQGSTALFTPQQTIHNQAPMGYQLMTQNFNQANQAAVMQTPVQQGQQPPLFYTNNNSIKTIYKQAPEEQGPLPHMMNNKNVPWYEKEKYNLKILRYINEVISFIVSDIQLLLFKPEITIVSVSHQVYNKVNTSMVPSYLLLRCLNGTVNEVIGIVTITNIIQHTPDHPYCFQAVPLCLSKAAFVKNLATEDIHVDGYEFDIRERNVLVDAYILSLKQRQCTPLFRDDQEKQQYQSRFPSNVA